MDIVDQYTIWLECFNHDMMESDQLIGSAQFSLLPVFKRGELYVTVFPSFLRQISFVFQSFLSAVHKKLSESSFTCSANVVLESAC